MGHHINGSRIRYRLDRALSGGIGRQLIIYAIVVLLIFLFLWLVALLIHIPIVSEKTDGFSNFWTMLFFFYDGGLEGTKADNRWFVYLANLLGSIVMGGILVATITNFLQGHTTKAEEGLLRYRLSGHSVFIGYHESMIPNIKSVLESKGTAVVLTEQPAGDVRDLIASSLDGHLVKNLIVYHGLRTSLEELKSLCLENASAVYIFPSQDYSDTDSVNLDVIDNISRICEDNHRTDLDCTAIFNRELSGAAFTRADVNKRLKNTLRFKPIIYSDSIAKALLSGDEFGNQVLDREPITEESNNSVNLFIIGLGEMGQALFRQAARQLHFPNYSTAKSKLTLVGSIEEIQQVKERYREFLDVADHKEEYAYLGDILDITVSFLQPQELDSSLAKAINDTHSLVTVAVCLDDSETALKKALSLPRSVFERKIPVWLYKPDSDSIVRLIGEESFYTNIVPFGNPGDLCSDGREILAAQRVNWAYSYYSQKGEVPKALPGEEEWNRVWLPAWNGLSIKDKWSNLHNAESIPVKLRSLGVSVTDDLALTDGQLESLSRVEHNRWVAETLLAGFRPPTESEREEIISNRDLKKAYKARLIHLDLCRFDDLLPDANGTDVRDYDRAIVACTPLLIKK